MHFRRHNKLYKNRKKNEEKERKKKETDKKFKIRTRRNKGLKVTGDTT